jgi:hypothetical protein
MRTPHTVPEVQESRSILNTLCTLLRYLSKLLHLVVAVLLTTASKSASGLETLQTPINLLSLKTSAHMLQLLHYDCYGSATILFTTPTGSAMHLHTVLFYMQVTMIAHVTMACQLELTIHFKYAVGDGICQRPSKL